VATRRFDTGETLTVAVEVAQDTLTDIATVEFTLDTRHGEVIEIVPCEAPQWRALEHDGTHLWTGRWQPGWLYAIEPATGDTVRRIPAPSRWPNGIAWDGAHLWASDYLSGMKMFQVDRANGDTLSSFPIVYSGHQGGLAWDGEHLYHGSNAGGEDADGRIHKYLPDGTHAGSFECPHGSVEPNGLAFDGENLWVVVDWPDSVYVVDPEDGTLLRSFNLPGRSNGIAVDGVHLWAFVGTGLARVVP
jgi:sugar lactone lactonase YvrE